jgi:hypothetical protein
MRALVQPDAVERLLGVVGQEMYRQPQNGGFPVELKRNGLSMSMANQEQLALLKSGVEKWNEWRESNREKIRLNDANLSGADLSGAKGVNLSKARR